MSILKPQLYFISLFVFFCGIQILGDAIDCTVTAFDQLAKEHKEFVKMFFEYEKNAKTHIKDLKDCEKIENKQSKKV